MPKGIFTKPLIRSKRLSIALKGRVISDEWKRKISEAHKGKAPWNKGKNMEYKLWPNGRVFSEETRAKMSKARIGKDPWNKGKHNEVKLVCKRCEREFSVKASRLKEGRKFCSNHCFREFNKGGNHHSWQGGLTPLANKIRGSLEYKLWEDSVFNRDGNKCQKCDCQFISKLVAHHIMNFAQYIELRFAIDNGITFCRDCHKKFHKKYGKKNNTKGQVEKFLTQK